MYVFQHGLDAGRVISMRTQIPVGEHVEPGVTVFDKSRLKRLSDDVSRGDRRQGNSLIFQPVFESVPGQLKGIFETLDDPLALQLVERSYPRIEGVPQQRVCAGEAVKSKFPPRFTGHPVAPLPAGYLMLDLGEKARREIP